MLIVHSEIATIVAHRANHGTWQRLENWTKREEGREKNSGNTTLRESGVSCGWQSCWKGKWRSKTWNRSSCRNVCVSDTGCMVDGERDVARAVSLTPISGVTKPTTFPYLTCPHEHTHTQIFFVTLILKHTSFRRTCPKSKENLYRQRRLWRSSLFIYAYLLSSLDGIYG